MKKTPVWVGFAVWLAGCGTIGNFADGIAHPEDGPRIYGGIQKDVEFLDQVASGAKTDLTLPFVPASGGGEQGALGLAFACALYAAEPILSFAADTATLPITIRAQKKRAAARKDRTWTQPSASLGLPQPEPQPGRDESGQPE